MAIEIKEFEEMVNDTLRRITNSTGISNIRPGSVVRTLVESILAEQDIQYYQIKQIFDGMDIDSATGEDLDRLIKILGVVRKGATSCVADITFGRSTPMTRDVAIPYGSVVSTYSDNSGGTIEFVVDEEDAKLPAGQLEVKIRCHAKEPGIIYVPMNTVAVMNKPILNIEYVNNDTNIYGGSVQETDDELRERSKTVFSSLGKGTAAAIENAIMAIDGVQDVVCLDCARGVGTVDAIVVTATIPTPPELAELINTTAEDTKAAGIDVQITYPTTFSIDVKLNIMDTNATADTIGNAVVTYMSSLGVAEVLIINQLERAVLNACGNKGADIKVITPAGNVTPAGTQIIRCGTVTINGEIWHG